MISGAVARPASRTPFAVSPAGFVFRYFSSVMSSSFTETDITDFPVDLVVGEIETQKIARE
jgi:hypothetical protein